jgi:hypothetical protein
MLAPAELTDALCAKWWVAMGDIFGTQWYVQNGPEPTGVWKSSLSELRLERAMAVLQHFRVSGDQFPPNLSQVMSVARSLKLNQETHRALPPPKRSEEQIERVSAGLKSLRDYCQGAASRFVRPEKTS